MVHGLARSRRTNVLHAVLRPSTCGVLPYLAVCQNQSHSSIPFSLTPLITPICAYMLVFPETIFWGHLWPLVCICGSPKNLWPLLNLVWIFWGSLRPSEHFLIWLFGAGVMVYFCVLSAFPKVRLLYRLIHVHPNIKISHIIKYRYDSCSAPCCVVIFRLGCWVWVLACDSERFGSCGKFPTTSTRNLTSFPIEQT